MTYYRFPNTKLFKIGFFLFLLTLQMLSRSAMVPAAFLGFHRAQYLMIGLVIAAGLLFLFVNRFRLKEVLTDKRMIAVIGIVVLLCISMVVKGDFQLLYFSIMIYLLFAVFVTYFLPMQEAAAYYVALMTVLSVWTLMGLFVLKPMVEAGWISGHPFMGVNGWFLYNFGLTFTSYMNNEQEATMRAFGIFREPGLFQVFLFTAIQLNNYVLTWKKTWQMWAVNACLFGALMVTFATGGVFAMGLYIMFLFFDKGLYKNKWLRLAAIMGLVIAAILVMIALAQGGTWAYELVGMVEKVFNNSSSFRDRVDSVTTNAKIFLENPLFGEKISYVMYAVFNNTASSPIIFAAFGIVGGCLHVLSWTALVWRKERSILMNLILMVILFIPFNTQNVIHDMFFWLFPVMALVEKGIPMLGRIMQRKKA